jgi:CarD family transcriptional regulator
MKFETGDAVVHPVRGAGVVKSIEERQWRGNDESYYSIRLLYPPASKLMIPASAAKEAGLRRAASKTKLKKMWRVLRADPGRLPTDHKERYAVLEGKMYTGDVLQVAEVVRDMAWRQRQEGRLTTVGKQMYDKGVILLAGEIAVAQGIDLADAEAEVQARLRESLPPSETS